VLKQEALFRQAAKEIRYKIDGNNLTVDHLNGTIHHNGDGFGLVFPRAMFPNLSPTPLAERRLMLFFSGYFEPGGGRAKMLEPLRDWPESRIENSMWGRIPLVKKFNGRGYIRNLSDSVLAPCPMHLGWPGQETNAWTYRFAEAVLLGSIPVVFRDAPLGENFTKGFHFLDAGSITPEGVWRDIENLQGWSEANHKLARAKFFLEDE
jgi:hypothetical protein